MNLGLSGARVIVTGGAGGIGRAIVNTFVAEGAKVATCDINQDALANLPEGVIGEQVDVANAEAFTAFIDNAIAKLGGLDCLVNNVGIAGPTKPVEDIELAEWENCVRITLTTQFLATRRAVTALRKSSNPSIINMSSAAGRMGYGRRTPYAAAKWGVIGLTKSLSVELGKDGIRVNAILPGIVAGERISRVFEAKAKSQGRSVKDIENDAFAFTSIKTFVDPKLIADQIMFLASKSGRMTSGEAIGITGDIQMLI